MDGLNVRSLASEELPQWAAFCADCFSEKGIPPPASYFLKHAQQDPTFELASIWVAEHDTVGFVGSARVFIRKVRKGVDLAETIAGIGEVCVKKDWRGRGVGCLVFEAVQQYRRSRGISLSSLHCGPQLIPFYEKFDYKSISTGWVEIPVGALKSALATIAHIGISQPSAPPFSNETLAEVARVHQKFSCTLCGTYVRDDLYYKKWWQCEVSGERVGELLCCRDSTGLLLAYIVRRRQLDGTCFTVIDYGNTNGAGAFASLVKDLCRDCSDDLLLRFPRCVIDALKDDLSVDMMLGWKHNDDCGWMHSPAWEGSHAFWPIDSF